MRHISSLRARLLLGILAPIAVFIVINSVSLYRQSLAAATTAYDRTLLASAKTIGEQLDVEGYDEMAQLRAIVPYSALEAFEADNRSRLFYRVSALDGEMISGFAELPFWRGRIPDRSAYAALVDFYDAQFRNQPVRVAVLLQPVASARGRGMAVVQVAETLEIRETLARKLLVDTLWRQFLLMGVIALATLFVVQRATRPVRELGEAIEKRAADDLSPIDAPDAPRELRPLIDATTEVMGRLQRLLDHQKRFVRDSAHQLRTPLAVLKAQVQSARRGDVAPEQALGEISQTVERATTLANQMLSLAKVEQLRQQPESVALDLGAIVRQIALDLSPLVADKALDFELAIDAPVVVRAHQWMLQELTRNLLHNAIKLSPTGAALSVSVRGEGDEAVLMVRDDGPGIAPELRQRLFAPFSAGSASSGSGLGLAICREIVLALDGRIALDNRVAPATSDSAARVVGLDAVVHLPLWRHNS
ncbi:MULTISPECIES: sensor histidine kinase [Variovorax]|jgi:two-component system, OmpR family, sensor histidine kinase TctE|uniref:sensor histidine kinase n=1 Tax=Variovorax TaxID=34072 RepID=UPI00086ACDAC|nr:MULTISPECIES: sensor histidine kinase N-terminal domain-containing protein [Variovorax]MBN8752325.1 sensor histidine kinase N-terminal domain-containing protein [Variovorax sp.]ODU18196.1 MAG: histidine kinase [Variovorax sp. SCN 67-85]ODV26795.1 MAG: histidine kinase [Variovorax sp. SCN 67-20]OJZ08885.1 MAG: sensor histidine kinase [Variovorax sp. 67-131]UKI11348.1 sensor histidine kinase N-terminal domain-containing protein [Variovorax paradoxus]